MKTARLSPLSDASVALAHEFNQAELAWVIVR